MQQEVIGQSEMYTSNAGREIGIASVKADAPDAPIHDTACLQASGRRGIRRVYVGVRRVRVCFSPGADGALDEVPDTVVTEADMSALLLPRAIAPGGDALKLLRERLDGHPRARHHGVHLVSTARLFRCAWDICRPTRPGGKLLTDIHLRMTEGHHPWRRSCKENEDPGADED